MGYLLLASTDGNEHHFIVGNNLLGRFFVRECCILPTHFSMELLKTDATLPLRSSKPRTYKYLVLSSWYFLANDRCRSF
jgi:hypothetical protein